MAAAAHLLRRPGRLQESRAHCGCAELLCLVRLHEIILAGADPVTSLGAMVDELVRVPDIFRAVVMQGEPDGRDVRYLAHVGLADQPPQSRFRREATPMVAQAMATGHLVQLTRSDGGGAPHACVNVPILGATHGLGVLGLAMRRTVPIDEWAEHLAWAAADLMALVLHAAPPPPAKRPPAEASMPNLTRRQSDALFELVEDGATNEQIAARLGVSPLTVKVHLSAAFRQLGVKRRSDAVRLVLTRHAGWLAHERSRRS